MSAGHRGSEQRPTSPQHTVFSRHPRTSLEILPVLFLPAFYLYPYFLQPRQFTEVLIKLLWALWPASQPWTATLHGQGHSKEKEAERGGRILSAAGSTSILITSSLQGQHLWVACTHSLDSFMEQQTLMGVLCSASPPWAWYFLSSAWGKKEQHKLLPKTLPSSNYFQLSGFPEPVFIKVLFPSPSFLN